MRDNNNLRMTLKAALDNLWSRISGIFGAVNSRIDDAEDLIDDIETDVSGVTSRVAGVETRMTTAEGQITGLDNRVDDIEDVMDELEGDMIKSITFNGTNVPKDAQGNVALQETDPNVPAWAKQQMARTSDFTNDGPDGQHPYITAQDVTVPTKTSDLTNDGDDGNTYYVTWRQLSNSKDQAFISEDHIELTPDNIHDEFVKDVHYQGEANFLYITPAGMAAMLPEDTPYAKYLNCTFRGVYFTEKQNLTWDDYNILGWMEGAGVHELVTGYVDTTVGYGGEDDTIYITSIVPISGGGGGGGGGGDENIIEAISFNGTNVPPDSGKRVSLTESDPTVPEWAKAQTKPVYTAQEVGALPDTTTFVSSVKGKAESSFRSGNVILTPANIGAVAKSGDTMNGILTVNNDSYSNEGFVRFWKDGEGGNIVIASPNGKEFQIDANTNNQIRLFASDDNDNYKAFTFDRTTGAVSAPGGFNGNATTATGVKDAGDSSRTITIRYSGGGVDATGWVPMYDSSGNLVPVTTANLGKKLGVSRVLVSASIAITASMPFDLSAYSRIEMDFCAASQFGHLVMTEKNQWYYVSYLSDGAASATNFNMYAIKAKYTNSGITIDYCGYKNLDTGVWNDRIGNSGYLLRNIYGYA